MSTDYIIKVKANLSAYARQKTLNILDGSYVSVYKGRSLDFDDLRPYVVGDNVKDIDWKSSSRNRSLLVRRFVAEKRHNVLFVLDTGLKMTGDAREGESKKEISLITFGTLAYIVNKHGDEFASIYTKDNSFEYSYFKTGMYNIQNMLNKYEYDIEKDSQNSISDTLEYVFKTIRKKMMIFIITDLDGMEKIKLDSLKKLSQFNDLMLVNVDDAYLTGDEAYDMEDAKYKPGFLLKDQKLSKLEREDRQKRLDSFEKEFRKNRTSMVTIGQIKEVVPKIIELLERHRNENFR